MSKKTKKWYRRTHDFAPYTRADGKAVSDEFDAIQASFEKIPAMRDDGLGFTESPIIPDPTEDNHPVPFHLLKAAERSVYVAKESVETLAQQVADNNNTTEQNTRSAIQANQQAAKSQQLASQSATQAAEANKQAQQAQTQAQSQAQTATSASSSAQQSATQASESENLAQKWAANPVDEQVQGGKFSAYHYATKARLSAEKAENIADGRKDWSDIDNVPISTDVNDNSKTNLASAFIVKTAYNKAVEAKELAELAKKSANNVIDSPALTGVPTAPTASQEANNAQIATTAFVKAAIATLVGSAPAALDTLQELATALGQDANFRNTVLNQIAGKANTSHTHLYNQITDFEQGVLHYLTQGFSQNLNENGWVKFPNGLILQWGKVNRTANSKLIFPIAFPKVCLFLGFTPFFESGWSYAVTVHSRSKLTNTHANFTNQHGDAMFFAVGY